MGGGQQQQQANEKEPLLSSGGLNDNPADVEKSVNDQSDNSNAEPKSCTDRLKEPFAKRPKTCICLGVTVVFIVLFMAFAVPEIAKAVMRNYMQTVAVEVHALEVLAIADGVATVRLEGKMSIDAPFSVAGRTSETTMELLVADPTDNFNLGVLGNVALPVVEAEGLTIYLNITTTLEIVSDKLFHVLLTDVVFNSTVWAVLAGDIGVTVYVPLYNEITAWEYIAQPVSMNAMGGLVITIQEIDLYDSSPTMLALLMNFTVYNNADFYASTPLYLYDENFMVYFEGVYFGQLYAGSLNMGQGASKNQAVARAFLTNETEESLASFLTGLVTGTNVTAFVNGSCKVDIGFPQTPDNPATLQTNLTIEGPSALIEDAWFKALPGSRDEMGVMVEVEVFARLHNPLLFNVSVDTFDSDFFLMAPDNPQCNTTVSSLTNGPSFGVAGQSYACIPCMLETTVAFGVCMGNELRGDGLFLMMENIMMMTRFGEFAIALYFDYGPVQGFLGECVI